MNKLHHIRGSGPAVLVLTVALAACSSSTSGTTGGSGSGTGSSSGSSSGASGAPNCTSTNALTITFSPMYSGFITDWDAGPAFLVPAIVSGVNTSAIAWYGAPNVVSITPTNASEQSEGLGDVIVQTSDAGTTTITAEVVSIDDAGMSVGTGVCGTSLLTVTPYTGDQWDAGFTRYYDGVRIVVNPDAGCDAYNELLTGGFSGAACNNCHEATESLNFGPLTISTVSHTPEQTGGFSDDQMENIIKNGQMPDANFFTGLDMDGNATGLTYAEWQQFHHWTFDSDGEFQGVLAFLRSLPPTPQLGAANFGGVGGGHRRRGRPHGRGRRRRLHDGRRRRHVPLRLHAPGRGLTSEQSEGRTSCETYCSPSDSVWPAGPPRPPRMVAGMAGPVPGPTAGMMPVRPTLPGL